MPLDALLIEILVDPEDKQSLYYFADEEVLYNPRLRRRYEVRDGIPILLISEATEVDDEEHLRRDGALSSAVATGVTAAP
ncbi:MAG TPA: Trm112 family protein [Acidimicrobiales bacterium]|nr:Trm112 family protein [Acidimicrobiales bacterium]